MERWESLLDELRAEFILREDELRLLHAIDLRLLVGQRPLNTTFEFIVRQTQELLKSNHTGILLRRSRYLEPAYSTAPSEVGQRIDISKSLVGSCLVSGVTINIPDVRAAPYSDVYVQIKGYEGPVTRSLIAAPIKVHDTVVGVVGAESERVNAYTPVHEKVLAAIAAQIAIAFQRAQSFDHDALLAEVDHLILEDRDSPRAVEAALRKVMDALQKLEHVQLTGADIMFRHGKDLEIVHSTRPLFVGMAVSLDDSICGRAVKERKTVNVSDVNSDPDYRRGGRAGIKSEIVVPIMLGDDNVVIGVLNVESAETDAFQGFSQVILESFADKVRTLLAFTKLRADLTEALEVRNANDLLIAVGDQASNMIHRLNNTVGVMRLRLLELQDMLEEGGIKPTFLTESLEALRRLADRALEMPEDVTRLLSQEGSSVNVNEAVRTALASFDIPDNVALALDLDLEAPSLPLYSFDVVVQNLLQNALDAMPGGGTLTVRTASMSDPELPTGYVQLSVGDTGTGIADDILPKIFELNFSTKHTKGKGHGLGLWWIRTFVRRSEGDISVSSTVNSGSEFTVKVPFTHAQARISAGGADDTHREGGAVDGE